MQHMCVKMQYVQLQCGTRSLSLLCSPVLPCVSCTAVCVLYCLVLYRDSHMKSTYTAIRCIMLDFWDHSQGECAASSDAAQQLELHKAELFAPRNLTLLDITEPRCLHLLGGGRICFLHAVRGETLVSGDTQVRSSSSSWVWR